MPPPPSLTILLHTYYVCDSIVNIFNNPSPFAFQRRLWKHLISTLLIVRHSSNRLKRTFIRKITIDREKIMAIHKIFFFLCTITEITEISKSIL